MRPSDKAVITIAVTLTIAAALDPSEFSTQPIALALVAAFLAGIYAEIRHFVQRGESDTEITSDDHAQ